MWLCRSVLVAFLALGLPSALAAQIVIMGSNTGVGIGRTSDVIAGPRNGVDLAVDTTLLPGGTPDGWGSTTYGFTVAWGAPTGEALYYVSGLTAGGTAGYIVRFETFVPSTPAIASGTWISLHTGKGTSSYVVNHPRTPLAYMVKLYNDGGTYKFRLAFPTDAGEKTFTWSGVVSTNTVYRHTVEYNIRDSRIRYTVNGEMVADWTGTMWVAIAQTGELFLPSIGHFTFGSSGGSTGRYITFFLDRMDVIPLGMVPPPVAAQ